MKKKLLTTILLVAFASSLASVSLNAENKIQKILKAIDLALGLSDLFDGDKTACASEYDASVSNCKVLTCGNCTKFEVGAATRWSECQRQ